jgi:20S proteasome alpha/beta subunit
MTICIAGIAENKKIVAFTDRMLTIGAPVRTAFEITENNKAIKLADKVVAMFAGDVLKANSILKIAKSKIQNGNTGTEKVAEIVQASYKEQWVSDIEGALLQRFGLDRKSFINKQKELDADLVKSVNNLIGNYNLGVEIIIAGVDTSEPHIFKIENPGVISCYDAIGYCCIGSGTQHATFSIIESQYNPSFTEAKSIHSILQAKKRAQYDPGVGELTDVVLINDKYVKLDEAKVTKIDEKYEASATTIATEKTSCAEAIKTIIYNA